MLKSSRNISARQSRLQLQACFPYYCCTNIAEVRRGVGRGKGGGGGEDAYGRGKGLLIEQQMVCAISSWWHADPPLPSHQKWSYVLKDAKCGKTYEKTIFRICGFYFLRYDCSKFLEKCEKWLNSILSKKMWNVLKRMQNKFSDFLLFLVFEIWSILYSKVF